MIHPPITLGHEGEFTQPCSIKVLKTSYRRRLAHLFVDDEKDKRKKPILSYSQPITDSRNRILGAREEGEAGAFSR